MGASQSDFKIISRCLTCTTFYNIDRTSVHLFARSRIVFFFFSVSVADDPGLIETPFAYACVQIYNSVCSVLAVMADT